MLLSAQVEDKSYMCLSVKKVDIRDIKIGSNNDWTYATSFVYDICPSNIKLLLVVHRTRHGQI